MFLNKPPKLTPDKILDADYITSLVIWFVQNDPIVKLVAGAGIVQLFNEGYRVCLDKLNDPKIYNKNGSKISSPSAWLVAMVYLDMWAIFEPIKDNKNQDILFKSAIEDRINLILDANSKSLAVIGEMSTRHNISANGFVFKEEIKKIKNESELITFKENYIKDALLSADARILAWIYSKIFNTDFKPKS